MSNSWCVVNQEIGRNSSHRIHWKDYFGVSLSKEVARLQAYGLDADEVVNGLSKRLCLFGVDDSEVYRKLLIGVYSRFSENGSRDAEVLKIV